MIKTSLYAIAYVNKGVTEFVHWDCGYPQFTKTFSLVTFYANEQSAYENLEKLKKYSRNYLVGHEDFSAYKIINIGYSFVNN